MSKVFTIAEGLENMGALRTGGQGSVYKGRRTGAIITAVKILPTPVSAESAEDKNYRNFLNEVEKLKKVNEIPNPNVVKILNSGLTESGSFPFIEMEFIEGPDLEELLKPPHETIFTIKETIKLADQLACALSHCHKVGVKHGDIKSNNVKFNIDSGNYVLLDFGLSVMSDEQRRSSLRQAGAIEFMAPEQNEGKMLFQTDIYSYGIVLYELLTGQVPFPLKDNGETARNAVMIAHMDAPVPDLAALRQQRLPKTWTEAQRVREMQIPAWLLLMIAKCLEKSPEDRYINGMELHDALAENSLSEAKSAETENAIIFLKTENERLQARLLQYQAAEIAKVSSITVSRPLFGALILLFLAAITFCGYALFSRHGSAPLKVADTSLLKAFKPVSNKNPVVSSKKHSLTDTGPVKANPGINIPDNDSIMKSTDKKTNPVVHKRHRPKKKKFLGIF
jgi:serine/threonine protein kinase